MNFLNKLIFTPRNIFRGVFLFMIAMLASCDSDNIGVHVLEVVHPYGIHLTYPGQSDSIVFVTTNSYDITPLAEWIKLTDPSEQHGDIKYDPYTQYKVNISLRFDENTTGRLRYGLTRVDANDWYVAGEYFQTAWHNISRPMPVPVEYFTLQDGSRVASKVEFTQVDSALVHKDEVNFIAYGMWEAKLPSAPSWVKISDGSQGYQGKNSITLEFDENISGTEDRETMLEITGSGVTTQVKITQLHKFVGKDNTGLR